MLPSKANVEKISSLFHQMQATDSPKEKLEILLNIVTVIYSCVSTGLYLLIGRKHLRMFSEWLTISSACTG